MPFIDQYRRITLSGKVIPEIDGLRFVAILSVFVYHLAGDILKHSAASYVDGLKSNPLFSITQVLNIGVQLFFTISGFILALPFAKTYLVTRRSLPLSRYFLRRLTRLEIPYMVSLLAFFTLKVVSGRGNYFELLPHLLASCFYSHNVTFGTPSTINFVAWSLEIEIQFYCLAPAFAFIFFLRNYRIRRLIIATLILICTGISSVGVNRPAVELSLLGQCQYFLVGFLALDTYLGRSETAKTSWLWDLASVTAVLTLLLLLVRGGTATIWLTPWLIFILILSAFNGVITNGLVTEAWVATVGGMCYSIYLLHNYLIAIIGQFTERLFVSAHFAERLLIQFVLIGVPVIFLSGLYFKFVERPCMQPDWPLNLRNRIFKFVGSLKLRADATSRIG